MIKGENSKTQNTKRWNPKKNGIVKPGISKTLKVNIIKTKIEKAGESNYAVNVTLDNLEQYGRQDCIETSGIPTLPIGNPKQLTVELGNLMGIEITQEHISTNS